MPKDLILYVEDDTLSREVMELVIEDLPQFELMMFADSHNFLTRVDALSQLPRLILLDIHVQPITGFDMLELLRASPRYKNVRIVALTASVMSEEVLRLRKIGFDGAIAKPIDQDIFPQHIEQVLSGKSIWIIDSH
jgi:CheY-like chemotaxis protein